jgi:diphosphoinositol-polyphosphate diphosphatase
MNYARGNLCIIANFRGRSRACSGAALFGSALRAKRYSGIQLVATFRAERHFEKKVDIDPRPSATWWLEKGISSRNARTFLSKEKVTQTTSQKSYSSHIFRFRAWYLCARKICCTMRERSVCIVYREAAGNFAGTTGLEVLIVSSSKNRQRYTLPGGGVDPGEIPSQAAEREVFEEAGARGELEASLGVFDDRQKRTRSHLFSMRLTSLTDGVMEGRDRLWVPLSQAEQKLQKAVAKRMVARFATARSSSCH